MDFFVFSLFVVACCRVFSCQGTQMQYKGFISWDDLSAENYSGNDDFKDGAHNRIILVSKDGSGDSSTVQGAVNMVPDGNKERVKIFISPGVYREKVIVPITKPYISFIGNGSSETVISWHSRASDRDPNGQTVGTFYSASVAVESDYFCANGITIEVPTISSKSYKSNTNDIQRRIFQTFFGSDSLKWTEWQNTAQGAVPGAIGMQAVALRLSGDKAMLYRCRILGSQDTLFDHMGRHYFLECYIQGSIDFIFGNARSLYQGCRLHAVAMSYGAVAASQRDSPKDNSGFSFLYCRLDGSGILYLGRAWGRYARVVYSYCQLEGIIIPEGWSDWGDPSRTRTVWFGEFNCSGKGANLRKRVQWARSLNYDEARPFLGPNYIDGNQWLRL